MENVIYHKSWITNGSSPASFVGFFTVSPSFPVGIEVTAFSTLSGRAGTPDGAREARSGGLSLPTAGLAYYKKLLWCTPFKRY